MVEELRSENGLGWSAQLRRRDLPAHAHQNGMGDGQTGQNSGNQGEVCGTVRDFCGWQKREAEGGNCGSPGRSCGQEPKANLSPADK